MSFRESNPGRASRVGSEQSKEKRFEQFIIGYSELLHMSPRMPRHAFLLNHFFVMATKHDLGAA
jgi:hypothetical protein